MSIAVMSKVWKEAPHAGGDLLVFLALADWSDDQGLCWVKIANLAKKARISDRSAQYAVKQLVADGTLELVQESVRTQPRVYRISGKYVSSDRGADFARSGSGGVQSIREKDDGLRQIAPPYKEKQLSIKATVNKSTITDFCNSCDGTGLIHQAAHIPGPRLIQCPDCQPKRAAQTA